MSEDRSELLEAYKTAKSRHRQALWSLGLAKDAAMLAARELDHAETKYYNALGAS